MTTYAGRLGVMDTTTADPLIGQLLDGRYRVDARVARGGMATVYSGFDTRLDRVVAIKVMHAALAADEGFVDRFRREAKAAARLSHPHVVGIYDQGEDAGRIYLVMEHVPGPTLRTVLRDHGALSPAEALTVLEGLLLALSAAHDAGLVHRDVKPENILLTEDGRTVKVADFGLARAITASGHTVGEGMLIGTVAYVAPEQVVTGAADERTDVYSAGVVLFEMLTGVAPFTGDTPLNVAYQHVNDDVPIPSSIDPSLPDALDALVERATRRDPAERYESASTMLTAVRQARAALGESHATAVVRLDDAPTLITPLPVRPPGAPPTPAEKVAGKARRRRPRKAWVIAAVAFLVLVGAGVYGWWLGSGRYVDAPKLELSGLSYNAAVARAQADGFEVRRGETVFSEEAPAGVIADQDPEPGDRVRRGGAITLHESKGRDRPKVPDVAGKTAGDAQQLIEKAGLQFGNVATDFHPTTPKDRVIRTDPGVGSALKRDTVVDVVVSRGPQPVRVPSVIGAARADAERQLTTAGLKPVVAQVSPTTSRPAR